MRKEDEIRDLIIDIIYSRVKESNDSERITKYRKPVIGFASADDPLYQEASEIIGYDVFTPKDLLPEAQTVVSFFIPFEYAPVRYARKKDDKSNGEWGLAYYELNMMIGEIMKEITETLINLGIKAAMEPVTDNYDLNRLTTSWPHKTSAYIAGLGTFGINRVIITPMGCGGRLGTVVMSEKITPTERPESENCFYRNEGKCGVCVRKCHTGALKYNSFNRFLCNLHDNIMRDYSSALYQGDYHCCSGPCSFFEVPKVAGHHVWIGKERCEEIEKNIDSFTGVLE